MAEEEAEEEYKEVKSRRGKLTNLFKGMSSLQFVSIIILGIIFIYLLGDKTTPKTHLAIIGFSIIAILLYSQKAGQPGLISKEVAKRITVETLEEEKERYDIPADADIMTGKCILQYRMAEPLKWHVGAKTETPEGKISYLRVIIHPYDGIVIGVVGQLTEFSGEERDVNDIVVIFPNHYMEET